MIPVQARVVGIVVGMVAVATLPGSASAARTLYVSGSGSNNVAAHAIGSDGALTAVGSPSATGITPEGVAITPDARFLYVANFAMGANSVSGFAIDPDGTLSALPGSPFPTGAVRLRSP